MIDNVSVMVLVGIGLGAGLVGGLLGVGGSIIMIPAMTELLGPNQHLYQSAAMIVNFFVVVPAVFQHGRAGAIDGRTVFRIIPFAVVAVLVGVAVSELRVFAGDGERYLRLLFGLFLLLIAVADLYRLVRRRHTLDAAEEAGALRERTRALPWYALAGVAVPTGFVAGLLGIGGGILAVPLQLRLLRLPVRTAIANSAATIIGISLVGAFAKNYAYAVDTGRADLPMALAAVLIPTAIVGSLIGSRSTHRWPLRAVKIAFFVLLAAAAVRLIYGSV